MSDNWRVVETRGIRVITPFAQLHDIPLVRDALRWAEQDAQEAVAQARARLALARLVAQGCNFLLLDEPMAGMNLEEKEDKLSISIKKASESSKEA